MSDVIERTLREQVHGWDQLSYDVQRRLVETRQQQAAAVINVDNDDREAKVQAKFAELMTEAGLDPLKPETWKSTDYPTRYRCMADAEASVPGFGHSLSRQQVSETDEFGAGPKDPHEALAAAKADHALALAGLERARASATRATERVALHDADMARYAALDATVTDWMAGAIHDDLPTDQLPASLTAALDEHSRASDRLDAAMRAERRIGEELRLAESEAERCYQRVRAANAAIEAAASQLLKQELIGTDQHAHELRVRIMSVAAVIGQVPAEVMQVLNEPRAVVLRSPQMEQAIRDRMAARLEADA